MEWLTIVFLLFFSSFLLFISVLFSSPHLFIIYFHFSGWFYWRWQQQNTRHQEHLCIPYKWYVRPRNGFQETGYEWRKLQSRAIRSIWSTHTSTLHYTYNNYNYMWLSYDYFVWSLYLVILSNYFLCYFVWFYMIKYSYLFIYLSTYLIIHTFINLKIYLFLFSFPSQQRARVAKFLDETEINANKLKSYFKKFEYLWLSDLNADFELFLESAVTVTWLPYQSVQASNVVTEVKEWNVWYVLTFLWFFLMFCVHEFSLFYCILCID